MFTLEDYLNAERIPANPQQGYLGLQSGKGMTPVWRQGLFRFVAYTVSIHSIGHRKVAQDDET